MIHPHVARLTCIDILTWSGGLRTRPGQLVEARFECNTGLIHPNQSQANRHVVSGRPFQSRPILLQVRDGK